MSEPVKVQFRREGSTAFPVIAEKEPSVDSPSEETVVDTPAPAADAPAADAPAATVEKSVPFHQDPAVQEYIGRQVKKGTEEAVAAIRAEFGEKRQDNAEASKIPGWFGGNQAQWDEYRAWNEGQLKAAETRAIEGVITRATQQTEQESKAVKDATDFLHTEIAAITADKTLNPSGKPVDANALFKIVYDNQLVDTQGRWNYRAGMKLMSSHPVATHTPKAGDKDRKALAAATVGADSGGAAAAGKKDYKTSDDFKHKKPW